MVTIAEDLERLPAFQLLSVALDAPCSRHIRQPRTPLQWSIRRCVTLRHTHRGIQRHSRRRRTSISRRRSRSPQRRKLKHPVLRLDRVDVRSLFARYSPSRFRSERVAQRGIQRRCSRSPWRRRSNPPVLRFDRGARLLFALHSLSGPLVLRLLQVASSLFELRLLIAHHLDHAS